MPCKFSDAHFHFIQWKKGKINKQKKDGALVEANNYFYIFNILFCS